jgi:hypothetical protein
MKRTIAAIALLSTLILSASAAHVPEGVITENRDGRQLIIKTYTLPPEEDPAGLIQEPFDLDGFHYEHMETVKEDQSFRDSKQHTETVTLETSTKNLSDILAQLPPTKEYAQDGYAGVLTLDHTTLNTVASGYTSQRYTISDTRQYTDLDRNDPAYVPTTVVKNGTTLSLTNITWSTTGTGLYGDTLLPTSYTATATYSAAGNRQVATGYVTTANYTGEITAEGVRSVRYTVTYLGEPISASEPDPIMESRPSVLPWVILGISLLAIAGGGVAAFIFLRPNAVIYAMNAKGVAYKRLGAQRVTARKPRLDFTRLREYPAAEAGVELNKQMAQKLAGRLITIQLYDGTRTHLVEWTDGMDSYWFAVRDEEETERNEVQIT